MALKMEILFHRCQVWNGNYDFFAQPAKHPDPLPWKVTYQTFTDSFATHAEALEFAVKGGHNADSISRRKGARHAGANSKPGAFPSHRRRAS